MIVWDERKRAANLTKHGLDFADADRVYRCGAKLTFQSARRGETRTLDLAPLDGVLLAFVYVVRGTEMRAISLRRASRAERRMYERFVEEESH